MSKALAVVKQKKKATKKRKLARTNPHGVNQYTPPDPRQSLFFQLYLDRESPTFGNAKQSAIGAGFEESYANTMIAQRPQWFYNFLGQMNIVDMAEAHLREVLALPNVAQAMGAFGPIFEKQEITEKKKGKNGKFRDVKRVIKVPVFVPSVGVIKEKTAVAKIALPAHDPKYKLKSGPKFNFNFNNVAADREKFK